MPEERISISEFELRKLRLQAVLAEYQALRSEMLQKFQQHLQIYSIVVTAATLIIGWAVTQGDYDVLLVIPIFSSALSLRYIWEQNIIVMMGGYLNELEEKIFPKLLSGDAADSAPESRWIGWEHYFRANFPKRPLYKPASQILMVVVPMIPAVVYSALNLVSVWVHTPQLAVSHLHPAIHFIALMVYIPAGIYLSLRLWKS